MWGGAYRLGSFLITCTNRSILWLAPMKRFPRPPDLAYEGFSFANLNILVSYASAYLFVEETDRSTWRGVRMIYSLPSSRRSAKCRIASSFRKAKGHIKTRDVAHKSRIPAAEIKLSKDEVLPSFEHSCACSFIPCQCGVLLEPTQKDRWL